MPDKYRVMPVSHRKFQGLYCCKVWVAFVGVFWVTDPQGNIDNFESEEEAMAAGCKILVTILNRRIYLPPKKARVPTVEQCSPRLRKKEAVVEFGLFGSYD